MAHQNTYSVKEIKVACLIYKGCIQQRNMQTKAKCTESAKYRYEHR